MSVAVLIPARYDSTRFPGKVLADLGGRPLVEHVYRRASAASLPDLVIVATDDDRVRAAVEAFGGRVRMTGRTHRSGTDRVAEAAADLPHDIIVNVQGDEPLVEPSMIDEVVGPLLADATLPMATLRRRLDDPAEAANPHVVKVVVDREDRALYFSRAAIPHRSPAVHSPAAGWFKHIGLYAYRRRCLLELAGLPPTPLELAESLEQLRALEHGYRLKAIATAFDSIGVDTPEDLERARRRLGGVPA